MESPPVGPPNSGMVRWADYPLYVVTAATQGETSACLAGFVTQCSIEPPRYLICISKQNHSFRVAERAAGLGLHLLGADQAAAASHFGELSGDVVDKLAGVAWHAGRTGAPVLEDCAAWVEGRVLWHTGAGDHEAFVITVAAGGAGRRQGALMSRAAPSLRAAHPPDDATTLEGAGLEGAGGG